MSTGLTYVTIVDSNEANPQSGISLYSFASYSEAYEYGDWFTRLVGLTLIGGGYIVGIYTTGPNANGYWQLIAGTATFVPYD
jgi:hypothetical protein